MRFAIAGLVTFSDMGACSGANLAFGRFRRRESLSQRGQPSVSGARACQMRQWGQGIRGLTQRNEVMFACPCLHSIRGVWIGPGENFVVDSRLRAYHGSG
jgi:hypothetical protein